MNKHIYFMPDKYWLNVCQTKIKRVWFQWWKCHLSSMCCGTGRW